LNLIKCPKTILFAKQSWNGKTSYVAKFSKVEPLSIVLRKKILQYLCRESGISKQTWPIPSTLEQWFSIQEAYFRWENFCGHQA